MSCGIYKITNKVNNQSYIGQSFNIEERWKKEKQRAFQTSSTSYNTLLSQAFRKYGINNFSFEILELCSNDKLDELEQYYIQKYNTYFNGYNSTIGGQFCGGYGNSIKISKTELLEIYDLLQNSTLSQKEIAIRYNVGQDTISTINQGKSRQLPGYKYPLRNNRNEINYCIDCHKPICCKATRCDSCAKKQRRKVSCRPTREELKNLIKELPFTTIGKQFNVSDSTIRKWCKSYDLPSKKSQITTYSEQEWQLL